ncbi:hypothetical protein [Candidatus Contubernalis alkaliaceticus]|uniref:hypothetical protein n=1 Tax=Candidatus Contubernalis alkaliaceticus TaxID=338645 RepID=UPI001F4BF69C|nr:hypothetical protein [Candidatus Contubernalis alkalaceticus]
MLNPQFLDRFALYVEVKGEQEVEERKQVISRRLEYEQFPEQFKNKYQTQQKDLTEKIYAAQKFLEQVEVSENIIKMAAEIAQQAYCQGHRADLVMVETARTIAALQHRLNITLEDLKDAAELALPHRVCSPPVNKNQSQEMEQEQPPEEMETEEEENKQGQDNQQDIDPTAGEQEVKPDGPKNHGEQPEDLQGFPENQGKQEQQTIPSPEGLVEEPGEAFRVSTIGIDPFERKIREAAAEGAGLKPLPVREGTFATGCREIS